MRTFLLAMLYFHVIARLYFLTLSYALFIILPNCLSAPNSPTALDHPTSRRLAVLFFVPMVTLLLLLLGVQSCSLGLSIFRPIHAYRLQGFL